jgi:hypothetical protein
MFKLRLRLLMKKGQREIAEAHLEGAWRALSAVIGQRDAAIMILRNIDRDHWHLTPRGMVEFILERFDYDHHSIVPGEHSE